MNSNIQISRRVFESLLKHLVEIEEDKDKLIEDFFPGLSKEREYFCQYISDYIQHLQDFLINTSKSEIGDNNLPFVTVGCEVEVEELGTSNNNKLRLVRPFQKNVQFGDVSFFSPVGKSFLLKKVGDEVKVNAPDGEFCYLIKSIKYG